MNAMTADGNTGTYSNARMYMVANKSISLHTILDTTELAFIQRDITTANAKLPRTIDHTLT